MSNQLDQFDRKPVVLMIFCARDLGDQNAGGGIYNAVLGHVTAVLACGGVPVVWTASKRCAEAVVALGGQAHSHNIWNSGISPFFSPVAWREVRKINKSNLFGVIHHSGRTWLLGYIFFPQVINAQIIHRENTKPYRFFRRWFTLSTQYREYLKRTDPLRMWRKVSYLPNCIRPDLKFTASPPTRLLDGRPLKIGSMGRLGHGKGTDVVIEAAGKLHQEGLRFELHLQGGDAKAFEVRVKELGLGDKVRFLEWNENVEEFFDAIDVFVLPSRKEPFGLVVIEAMARSLPVIATDTNGPMDIIVNGKTGWIVPVGDTAALAERIRYVDRNRQTALIAGAAGRQRVEEQYSPLPVGEMLMQVLRE